MLKRILSNANNFCKRYIFFPSTEGRQRKRKRFFDEPAAEEEEAGVSDASLDPQEDFKKKVFLPIIESIKTGLKNR